MSQTQLTMHQVIEEMETYLNETEVTYKSIQRRSDKIYERTTRIIKAVFSLIGLLLLLNIYFIHNFGEEIFSMLGSMNDMYNHFGNMGTQVQGITQSVEKMSSHITVLPSMSASMDSMNNTIININSNVHIMQKEVGYMSRDIGLINHDMLDMTMRFEQLNESMHDIGKSVHTMSRVVPHL